MKLLETQPNTKELNVELNTTLQLLSYVAEGYQDGIDSTSITDLSSSFIAARQSIATSKEIISCEDAQIIRRHIQESRNHLQALIESTHPLIVSEASKKKLPEYTNLDQLAQEVWKATQPQQKKSKLIAMIKGFKFKGKVDKFLAAVERETSVTKLDNMAANIMQVSHGDSVLKL